MWYVPVYRTEGQRPPHQSATRRTVPDLPLPLLDIMCRAAIILGKIWERTQNLKTYAKSHRMNGPYVVIRAHNPKVVSSNLTPATISRFLRAVTGDRPSFFPTQLHWPSAV
jgi:hypothetical protein